MKRNNKKLLTIMLAGMLCAATVGTVAAVAPVAVSAAEAKSYDLTAIFNSNDAANVIKGEGEGEARKTAFNLGNGDAVQYTRNLAIQWFTAKDTPNYTTVKFSLGAINFTSMSFAFKSLPMHATKDEVSVNTVKFTKTADGVSAKVIASGEEENKEETGTPIATDAEIVLSLGAGSEAGNYSVYIGTEKIGEFANVGAKYFRTNNSSDDKMNAFEITAEADAAAADSVVYLNEINGQSFTGITAENKVKDNAKPVMVVNEEISEFVLGTRFQLDYTFIDVLDDSMTTTGASNYYQYSLADTEAPKDEAYTTLQIKDKGTYFLETVVYKNEAGEYSKTAADGYTATTVYREKNAEYVSIKFSPKDDTYIETSGEFAKAVYDLSWYANNFATFNEIDYLIFNRNIQGPNYKAYAADELTTFTAELQTKASKVSAGSNAEIELPSLSWLIEDQNNGYNSLKFTISYKSHSSSSPKLESNLKSSELKLDATESGEYEFKVFATDAAGNAMYAKDNEGVDVKVTSDNVWDLDSIPSFSYTISAKGIQTADKEDNDTLDNKNIGESYTMSAVEIVGVTGSEGSEYKLYKLDLSKYTGAGKEKLTTDVLSNIKFASLKVHAQNVVNEKLAVDADNDGKPDITADKIDYAEVNRLAYARALAATIGGDAAALVNIFVEIDEYDDRITEDMTEAWDNSDNRFNWKPTSRSFKTAESGTYLILADYWDNDMKYVDHVPAYQLVEVASEKDVIKGETEWLKNNIVSVILFSVAALMLILIIILLLVKPSDETLEDVDEKIIAKRKQATDKNKKK